MAARTLRIGIALSGEAASFWRAPLARKLRAEGHRVDFYAGPADGEPSGLALLELLERLIGRRPAPQAAERPPLADGPFDVVVAGTTPTIAQKAPCLVLSCDGGPCAPGAIAAILDGRRPLLEARLIARDAAAGAPIARALPALEEPHDFTRSRERLAERLADVALIAVRKFARPDDRRAGEPSIPSAAAQAHPLRFAAQALTGKIAARLSRLLRRDEIWRIAWRLTSGDEVLDRGAWSAFTYRNLPDDGRRYYADPFVFASAGRSFILCEEYPFATQKGLISVVEIADGLVVAPPHPILELPYHLSYPMVFAREGQIWMIPETSAVQRIELWRARRFPDLWEPAGVLVDGVAASDATLLEKDGRLWLFASVAEGAGSSWDCLHLWSAARLAGPWSAHCANPALIDATCARPAGAAVIRGGNLLRPAQDCSRLYGGGLAICSIDRLDEENFTQTLRVRLGPPPGVEASGVHTLNAMGNIEAIDLFGARPKRDARAQRRPANGVTGEVET